MKFWTVQSKEVVEIIEKEGVYIPDFSKSDYLKKIPELSHTYELILTSFNRLNNTNLKGVVFGFGILIGGSFYDFLNYNDFKLFINQRKSSIEALWRNLGNKDVVILEVEVDYNQHDPVYLDINDFQALMPPIMETPPYDGYELRRMINSILEIGFPGPSVLPSNIAQIHIPMLKKADIVGVYPMFVLDNR